MKIYAIGDLHLSGKPPSKPMEIFGKHWADHAAKVAPGQGGDPVQVGQRVLQVHGP